MKHAKTAIQVYFNSWWLAPLIVLAALLLAAGVILSYPLWGSMKHYHLVADALAVALAVTMVGALVAGIWHLVRRRWWQGIAHLAMMGLAGAGTLLIAVVTIGIWFSGKDHFADGLTIPEDIEVTDTKPDRHSITAAEDRYDASTADPFQADLLAALRQEGGDDPTVTAAVEALTQLHAQAPEVLNRYLAASPAWRVFEERGRRYATRRWRMREEWQYTLHGYYVSFELSPWDRSVPKFQFRMTLGLSGEPWAGRRGDATQMRPGQTGPLTLTTGNQMFESWLLIDGENGLVVEIFEQSAARERRLTRASLAHLQAELTPLGADPRWETIQQLLPAGSIRHGQPTIELRESFQPGIYDAWIWVNPGEPGMIYLKAFEVTKGTQLSADRLKESSNEWVGWSDDPNELFLSNTHLTIYEGDWGKPYAARFEVWFVPDAGGAERKLLEKVFRIEGWQR